ncbi:DHA2 family efflux MFS transporter permease subunit [Leuconostoc palmae]|uniref:DHA2 family efflux MFS transporter permease subunit n=1 Tax=Leuconostoc palmae TaxID=501487 RepID=UPI001C7D9F2E|nr:DHA2 family efflux MFS transporter permease subunit [Leuconostoc palmae]
MKKTILISVFVLGIFVCMLDTTIMNVSLPSIGQYLNTGLDQLSWTLSIYLILFASLTIPLTRLAEMFGMFRGFMLGTAMFGIGSAISAVSSNLTTLLVGRAIQSCGAALIFPLAMTLAIRLVTGENRTKVISILGITQGLAAALGPTIGGVITQLLGWRWIFVINLPLVISMLIFSACFFPFKNENRQVQKIDIGGAISSMMTLGNLSIGLINGRLWGWTSWETILCLTVSVLSFILFICIEKKSQNPMVPLKLFADKMFSLAAIIIVLSNVFLVAIMVILPNYFTNVGGMTTLHASLLIAPISFAIFIFAPISGFIKSKISAPLLLGVGFILIAAGYGWLGFGALKDNQHTMIAGVLVGIGYGLITGPILVISAGQLEGASLTASQSVTGVLRQVGSMLAVAIFITGLYSGLAQAKTNSIDYASRRINQTHLSNREKLQTLDKINHSMTKTKFEDTNTTHLPPEFKNAVEDIENLTKNQLRFAFEKLYRYSVIFILISAVISLFLKEKRLKRGGV